MDLILKHRTVDEKPARGYVVTQLDAFRGEQLVGYIRTSFLHKRLCYEVMPTVWHYMSYHKGWCFNLENPANLWSKVHQYAGKRPASRPDLPPLSIYPKDIPDIETIKQDLLALEPPFKRKMRKDISKHGNKPITEYIKVEEEFRRQGIGTQLYIAMANLLAESYDLPLYASGLQSPEAAATWKAMKARGLPVRREVVAGKKKLVLDYTS